MEKLLVYCELLTGFQTLSWKVGENACEVKFIATSYLNSCFLGFFKLR